MMSNKKKSSFTSAKAVLSLFTSPAVETAATLFRGSKQIKALNQKPADKQHTFRTRRYR